MAAESSTMASSSRSGVGGASADSYIGSLISLTSKSEIRYEGVLHNINTEESSIGLRNVRSFGTEGRKKDGPQVPPSEKTYEYILFRGSDIKDLQVKASPPVQTLPPINSDPAIIQSHYPRPAITSTSLPTTASGSLADLGSHSSQLGLPGSTFQSGLPLYQPGANLNSWGPPANANGSGLAMPMYWQGFYGTPNGLPQMPQQSLLRPPPGLANPPIQQMQFPSFNPSMPMAASNFPGSNLFEYQSTLVANNQSSAGLTSSLSASSLSLNSHHPLQSAPPLASETSSNLLPNKAHISVIPTPTPMSNFPSLAPLSTLIPDNTAVSSISNKQSAMSSSMTLPQLTIPSAVASITGASGSIPAEASAPSLVTPGQLLQSGPAIVFPSQPLQTTQKDVEVVQVFSKPSAAPSVPVVTEAQPPILPLPTNTRAQKFNGASYQMRNNYRGRGGRGSGVSRPVTKFTEDFDFMAMNEKFNKDEVWGHLGKNSKSQSKDKEVNGSGSDDYDYSQEEDDIESPKIEIKSVYNKDDFFDSLSSNALDNDSNHARTRYSEQMKLDTETFGDFSRFRGPGRGGRGPGRGGGGGRFRGSYYGGRGYGGYGYSGRGRGRGQHNHSS